jgi:hypothetical protein
MSPTTPAALGFRVHTGWAASVAVAGPLSLPRVVDRRRVALIENGEEKSAAVYHAAMELALPAAEKLVRDATDAARRKARIAIEAMIDELRAKGYEPVAAGIVLGGGRLPSSLEAILRSHPLVHTAEGELFRQALIAASEACELRVSGVSGRELYAKVASELGVDAEHLRNQLGEAGKSAGKPWAQDQKEAMAVAWSALAAATRSRGAKRTRS